MKKQNITPSFHESLIDEVIDEIDGLDANDLDAFLRELGEDPETLLESGRAVRKSAIAEAKLARLRSAQRELRANRTVDPTMLLSYGLDRKRAIFDKIKQRAETSGEMTLAARNNRIESDKDLDSFLEACLRLGLINEAGEIVG